MTEEKEKAWLQLMSRHLDGDATDEEMRRLAKGIEDSEVKKLWVQEAHVHARLMREHRRVRVRALKDWSLGLKAAAAVVLIFSAFLAYRLVPSDASQLPWQLKVDEGFVYLLESGEVVDPLVARFSEYAMEDGVSFRVGEEGSARVIDEAGNWIRIHSGSKLELTSERLVLSEGRVHCQLDRGLGDGRLPRFYELPDASVEVKGTVFSLSAANGEPSRLEVVEGKVLWTPRQGEEEPRLVRAGGRVQGGGVQTDAQKAPVPLAFSGEWDFETPAYGWDELASRGPGSRWERAEGELLRYEEVEERGRVLVLDGIRHPGQVGLRRKGMLKRPMALEFKLFFDQNAEGGWVAPLGLIHQEDGFESLYENRDVASYYRHDDGEGHDIPAKTWLSYRVEYRPTGKDGVWQVDYWRDGVWFHRGNYRILSQDLFIRAHGSRIYLDDFSLAPLR